MEVCLKSLGRCVKFSALLSVAYSLLFSPVSLACGPDGLCSDMNCYFRQKSRVTVKVAPVQSLQTSMSLLSVHSNEDSKVAEPKFESSPFHNQSFESAPISLNLTGYKGPVLAQIKQTLDSYGDRAEEFRSRFVSLKLADSSATDEDIAVLVGQFPNLREITLAGTRVTLHGLLSLCHLKSIWSLDLLKWQIPGDQLISALQKWAQEGSVNAMYLLGSLYDRGRFVDRNTGIALELFKGAAQLGSAPAQFKLGQRFQYGEGVELSLETAGQLYLAAANQGYSFAQYALAELIMKKKDKGELDYQSAFNLYEAAAKLGEHQSLLKLAEIASDREDFRRAAQFFELAAKKGSVAAMLSLAQQYREGDGVEVDIQAYLYWMKAAATAGSVEAKKVLGLLYLDGAPHLQVAKNTALAFEYLSDAAKNYSLPAIAKVGEMYLEGNHVQRDFKTAAWYLKAAIELSLKYDDLYDLDDDIKNPRDGSVEDFEEDMVAAGHASYLLANMYLSGKLRSDNSDKAIRLLTSASHFKHKEAKFQLAEIYAHGKFGVERDPAVAQTHLHWLANTGDQRAIRMLYEGYVSLFESNPEFAVRNSLLIADLKRLHPPAQLALGKLFLYGDSVAQDERIGLFFVTCAIRAGFQEAVQELSLYNVRRRGQSREQRLNRSRTVLEAVADQQ